MNDDEEINITDAGLYIEPDLEYEKLIIN